jgi:hypothetical protein
VKLPKQRYAISLSGSVSTDLNTVDAEDGYSTESGGSQQIPDGCIPRNTTTEQWAASARMSVKPNSGLPLSPGAGVKTFFLTGVMSSLSTSVYDEVDGSWVVDPNNYPAPVDPSVCAFTPFRVTAHCAFKGGRPTLSTPLALFVDGATFSIEHFDQAEGPIVDCPVRQTPYGLGPDAAYEGADFLDRTATKLRVRTVLALGKGRSTSASGTLVKPKVWWDSRVDGNETVNYKIKVKRVK